MVGVNGKTVEGVGRTGGKRLSAAKLGVAKKGPTPRRGKDFEKWAEMLTAVEDAFLKAEANVSQYLDPTAQREVLDNLLDVRAVLLGGCPWSDPAAKD